MMERSNGTVRLGRLGVLLVASLMLALVASATPFLADRALAADSGTAGSCTWELDNEGTLTIAPIEGTDGEMDSYDVVLGWSYPPWYNHRANILNAVIEPGVTSIGSGAFFKCASLESVTIPEGIKSFEDFAFSYCSSLESVTIPEGFKYIGREVFYGCTSLESVMIPEGVYCIDYGAFYGCSSLKSVTIPGGMKKIYGSAFEGCYSLSRVEAASLTSWLGISFLGPNANPLRSGAALIVDGETVTSLIIPEGVASIGAHAFRGCSSIKSVVIPEGVSSIDDYAFYGCSSLESVFLPSTLTSIGDYAFYNLANPSTVTVATQEQYDLLAGSPQHINTSRTTVRLAGSAVSIEPPDAVTGLVYTGSELTGVPAGEGYELSNDDSAVNAGSYEAVATLHDGYIWSDGSTEPKTISWSISKAAYDMSGVSFKGGSVGYDGLAHSLFVAGKLPEGVTVSYEGNGKVDAGSFEVVASFSSADANYEAPACMVATLVIKPAGISSVSISGIPEQTYTGSAVEPGLSLSFDGAVLAEGTDYEVSYENNADIGTATATVTGKGNFVGSVEASFEIISNAARFSDTPLSAWYVTNGTLDYVIARGIMSGTSDTTFEPGGVVTRAQVAMILYNLTGRPAVGEAEAFSDVEAGSWYHDAVMWARSAGVVSGYDDGSFKPGVSVTREQLACMLRNYAGNVAGLDVAVGAGGLGGFADAARVSPWAYDSVAWCVGRGIIAGTPSGGSVFVNPQGTAVRAEAAQMVRAFDEKVLGS